MQISVSGQPPLSAAPPRRRPSRRLVLALVALALLGLVTAQSVRAVRTAELAGVRLVVTDARPVSAATVGGGVQDAVVAVTVRNDGGSAVRVLQQRLDGGGPSDPGPSLAAGTSTVLAVRWRVLCAEIGGLSGPRSLHLRVRTRTRAAGPVRLPLGELRQSFRAAASGACTGRVL